MVARKTQFPSYSQSITFKRPSSIHRREVTQFNSTAIPLVAGVSFHPQRNFNPTACDINNSEWAPDCFEFTSQIDEICQVVKWTSFKITPTLPSCTSSTSSEISEDFAATRRVIFPEVFVPINSWKSRWTRTHPSGYWAVNLKEQGLKAGVIVLSTYFGLYWSSLGWGGEVLPWRKWNFPSRSFIGGGLVSTNIGGSHKPSIMAQNEKFIVEYRGLEIAKYMCTMITRTPLIFLYHVLIK